MAPHALSGVCVRPTAPVHETDGVVHGVAFINYIKNFTEQLQMNILVVLLFTISIRNTALLDVEGITAGVQIFSKLIK
jgi:hypothetical protein